LSSEKEKDYGHHPISTFVDPINHSEESIITEDRHREKKGTTIVLSLLMFSKKKFN
jgi:hypothetical protein